MCVVTSKWLKTKEEKKRKKKKLRKSQIHVVSLKKRIESKITFSTTTFYSLL